jgi:GTPase SAR1 family protein
MIPHQIAEELAAGLSAADFNEADTRHQILDRLIHEVLGWPHSAVACEQNVFAGYIDYVLRDSVGRAVLVIEAKRSGDYFQLPRSIARSSDLKRVRLKTLTTNRAIRAAVTQVMSYCPQVGSEYACVTNGSEFIIFRTFIRGRDFTEADALVIPSLNYFATNFTEVDNLLSYQAVAEVRSLQIALDPRRGTTRELYYPKNGIGHYDAAFARNEYAKFLDPIARRYFTDISPTDNRMMRSCYVFAQGTHEAEADLKTRLTDQLTPFFSNDGAVEISETRSGGSFAQRIAKSLAAAKTDVLIVYGGKGAGKSTFVRRLLYHDPPPELQLHAFPIIIDFLQAPQQHDALIQYVWVQAVTALDQDEILSSSIEQLVELFEDRFAVANRQELSAYPPGGIDYLRERNKLIALWREDKPYVTRRFVEYWKAKGKGLVICFDNTDQLPPRLQDLCFLTAQNVARELSSVVIISMREERYCRARTVGVLDAYHNSGYHLAAPDLQYVFTKRLKFLLADLRKAPRGPIAEVLPEDSPFDKLGALFVVCLRQFSSGPNNAMSRFLRECSRDNTRLALEFFRQFVTSGYTHI